MRDPHPPAPASRSSGSFDEDMRTAFGGSRPAAAELRELRFGPFTVVELCCEATDYGQSASIPLQDALLVSLQLRSNDAYDLWEDGKRLDCLPARRGTVNINDLRRNVVAASARPFHALTFTLPVRALDDDSDDGGRDLEPGSARTGLIDPVIHGLGLALLPVLEHPERAPHAFVEHVLLALRAHLAHRFGAPKEPERGGLSRRHLKRAQAFLEAHLSENVSLSEIAASCALSAAHFARSFQISTGMPPHRFLVERRVARARELLVNTKLPLSEIAVQCGFADQSHLTKTVRRVLGVTPGNLRANAR
jgi:AraC family transcriptional regulator